MGDKQINLGINFAVNKQNLESLQKTLDEIIAKAKQFEKTAPDYAIPYQEAAIAAKEFKQVLNDSWNTQLGKLDFSKVEKGLVSLYGSTKEFKTVLKQIGPEGQKAFNQFTNAIVNTQAPLKQTNAALDKLVVSFKNTVRYGISSSIWNNFSNSVRQAYTYIKDLDKSLNDIRIVSGQSADQMERLAYQANKTAQALGNSTLDYTKAALIYYQQGLSGSDVTERTEVTLKMANVLGESAKEVSNYMTAIWNNFAKGSETLEHYADVITALGASTAASSEEIATGLSKFAAVADTVGLSYEYASAALATVVAQTRQSADTVGTAFKTLFARIQDLELGKTLDDGVTLGKYALALQKVGITIKDSSNELKSMNTILSEMGEKWKTLNDAEKVALAQNVAGVRQYTQLIALMDNWDEFQTNLSTAGSAEGTLQSQQEIYLDSIEAHLQKLDTAWEGLYKTIFDEDALKSIADALTKLINLANTFVTGLGGGLNSIMYIAMSLANVFSNNIAQELIRVDTNMQKARNRANELKSRENLEEQFSDFGGGLEAKKIGTKQFIKEQVTNQKILDLSTEISEEDRQDLAILQEKTEEYRKQNEILNLINNSQGIDIGEKRKKIKNKNLSEEETAAEISKIENEAAKQWESLDAKQKKESLINDFSKRQKQNAKKLSGNYNLLDKITDKEGFGKDEINQLTGLYGALEKQKEAIEKYRDSLRKDKSAEAKTIRKELNEELELRRRQLKAIKDTQDAYQQANSSRKKNSADVKINATDENEIVNAIQVQNKHLEYNNNLYEKAKEHLKEQKGYNKELIDKQIEYNNNQIKINNNQREAVANIAEQRKMTDTLITSFTTIGTSISAFSGIIDTLKNPNVKGWEMWKSILMVAAVQARNIVSNIQSLKELLPTLIKMTGSELSLEALIVKVKKQGVLESIKELALNIKNAVVEAIRALLHGQITKLGAALVVALTVGLGLLTSWVVNLIKANTEEAKLKKAVEDTKKAAAEANEAYKETKEIFDTYTEARKNIDSLTEGTIEFYEAIQKSNEAAEQLIEKLGLVAGTDYGIDSNGLININEDRLNAKMFEEQQKTFRAQARKYEAQLKLEQYNQKQTVEQFRLMTSIGTANGRYGLSEQVARDILANPGSLSSRASELYGGNLEQINTLGFMSVTDAVDASGKNIQDSVNHMSVDFQRSVAQQNNLNNLIATNLIMGYGSQSDIAEYNKMTERMKKQVNQEIINAKNNNTNESTAEDKGFLDYLWSGAKVGLTSLFSKTAAAAVAANEVRSYIDNANQKTIVKEDYMRNVLGYAQNESGVWYDRRTGATIDYDKAMSNIDTDEARDRYNSGEYVTQRILSNQVNRVENYRKQLSETGLSKSSENYVIEALMGAQDAVKLMTEEELTQYLKMRYKNIDPEKLIKAAEEGNQYLTDGIMTTLEQHNAMEEVKLWSQDAAKNAQARLLEDAKAYRDTLADQAETLGTTAEALDIYAYAMDNAAGKTHKQNLETAEAAAAQYKFNKAYNEGRVAYANNKELLEKYAKAIKNNKDISYDLADAVGEVSKSLKQMGLSLSAESISKHLNLINKLLSGTEKQAKEAYEELYKVSQMDTLKYFFGDPADLKNGDTILQKYQEIIDAINATEPGKNLADNYAQQLADMINETELTIDQIKQLASQLNIEIPVRIKDQEEWTLEDKEFTTKAQAIQHRYKGEMPDPSDPSKNLPVDYTWVEYIEDKTDHFLVPKNTNFKVTKNTQNISKGQNFSIAPSNKKSGSGSSSKPDKKDPLETTIDRYHKVNTQITKVDNSLKHLQSQQDKLLGTNLVNNLIKQWQLLNTQIDNYTEKMKIARGEQEELAEKLTKNGVLFNEDGTVKNYAEAIKAQEAYVNSLIDKYNKMSKTQQESYKETIEQAEKDFDKFKTNIDRYDELVSDFIPQLQQDIQDSIDKQIELNVKKFNLEIDVTLNLNQATRDWNAWARRALQGFADADIFGKSQARLKDFYTYFNDNIGGDIQKSAKHVNEILQELYRMDRGEENVYGDNRAKGIEELKDKYTELMGQITDVIELQDELHQNWLDKMDEVQEKFSEQINSYQFLREILSHDLKVVELAFGADSYAEMAKFYEQQQNNYEKQLEFQRQQKDFWYAQMQAVENGTEEWDKAKEKWEDAVKEFNKILEEGLQNAIDKFKNAINAIFKELNNSITGGLGLEFIQTEWDLINKNADRYLDTINATYAVRQLEKKYTDVINKTNSITQQQKLKKVMDEQLAAIKEKEKLTQYDIDRANKLYEIELARITLEEARNNKSQMRLRRDSQGNYRYQYVADLDAIKQAEDNLDNLYNSLYNFDKDKYNNTLNDIYTSWNEYQQKMAEAALINDPQLRAEKQMLIQQEYNELLMQLEDEYQISKYNLQESFFNDWVKLNDMELEQFKSLNDNERNIIMTEMVPTWENGLSQMAEAFSGDEGFAKVTVQSWEEIKTSQKGYADDIAKLEEVSKQTFDAIVQGEDDAIVKSEALIEENQAIIDKYGDELNAVKKCYDEVNKLIDAHKKEMEAAKKAAEEAYNYYSKEAEAQQKAYEASEKLRTSQNAVAEANAKAATSVKTTTTTSSSSSSSSKSSSGGNSNSGSKTSSNTTKTTKATYTITLNLGYDGKKETKKVTEGDSVTLPSKTRDGYTFNGWDIPSLGICSSGSYTYKPKKSETVTALWTKKSTIASVVTGGINALLSAVSSSSKSNTNSWVKTSGSTYGLKKYATGGYTGDWNDGGRLAILHKKELVLNQTDTKNMLNAVSIIRNLSGTLGTEMLARLGNANAPKYTNGNSGASLLEQDVHIDATFPNVRNAAEIEEALNNLVNAASQRAMINR